MKVVLALICAFSVNAFAKGTLSFEGRMGNDSNSSYIAGISVYEKIDKNLAYNSFTGFGDAINPDVDTFKSWFVTKHQIDFITGDFVFSPGIRATYMPDWGAFSEESVITEGFIKLSYKLW